MADKILVGYFLEDRGHEMLLKALVGRIAIEKGLSPGDWRDDVRAAAGGKSIQEYRSFLKSISPKGEPVPFDIIVVASDGNCNGYLEKRNQLLGYAKRVKFPMPDILVFAIPDPHIERWYMNDPHGFSRAVGSGELSELPPYKCERGLYKKVMREAIASSGVMPQFGGYEYGEEIVKEMDLYRASKTDKSLKHFIDDLSRALTRLIRAN